MSTRPPAPPTQTGPAPQAGLPPVWRADARILLLGSFPGTASLAAQSYYAHPRNQFWPIVGSLINVPLADLPYPERLEQLRAHRIALWDTVGHCQRQGSLDSNIRHAIGNEFQQLLAQLPQLRGIGFNGQHAARQRRAFEALGYATATLPSTSPAHASLSLAAKRTQWLEALGPWLR
ncbi:MAG: DNA-deoxyinosine glycosylase [Lautropia sp.]|nr:DNA-deoxyinosine glycosylase [Lautropia sp.]